MWTKKKTFWGHARTSSLTRLYVSPSQASRRASIQLEWCLWVVSVLLSQYHGSGHTIMIFFTRLNISYGNFKHCLPISILFESQVYKIFSIIYLVIYSQFLFSNHFFFVCFSYILFGNGLILEIYGNHFKQNWRSNTYPGRY